MMWLDLLNDSLYRESKYIYKEFDNVQEPLH